jgi:hypothetical protein
MTAPSSTTATAPRHEVDPRPPAAPRDVPAALVVDEQEPAATVRKTFIALTAIGGLILLAPRQWVSGALLLAIALALYLRHRSLARREAPAPAASPPVAVASSETPIPPETALAPTPEATGSATPPPSSSPGSSSGTLP